MGKYSHIDITISDNNFATHLNWETAPQLYNSNHYPIIVELDLEVPISKKHKRWCLKSANWNGYRKNLELPREKEDSSVACDAITSHIKEAANNNKNVKISESDIKNSYCKTWWNEACRRAWIDKKIAFNRY